jgi:polyisoprenoid-binding protein YceI
MASISAPASLTTWKIDPAHTVAEFKVKHMMIANAEGFPAALDPFPLGNPLVVRK